MFICLFYLFSDFRIVSHLLIKKKKDSESLVLCLKIGIPGLGIVSLSLLISRVPLAGIPTYKSRLTLRSSTCPKLYIEKKWFVSF